MLDFTSSTSDRFGTSISPLSKQRCNLHNYNPPIICAVCTVLMIANLSSSIHLLPLSIQTSTLKANPSEKSPRGRHSKQLELTSISPGGQISKSRGKKARGRSKRGPNFSPKKLNTVTKFSPIFLRISLLSINSIISYHFDWLIDTLYDDLLIYQTN